MIKVKKIKPLFTSVVTTMDRYTEDVTLESGLIDTTKQQGGIKEYQTVVAIGGSVRDIKVGDLVCINPMRYAVKKHQEGSLKDGVITDNPVIRFDFPTIEMNGKQYLYLQDRDIDFVIEEFEEISELSPQPLILPEDKKIIKTKTLLT